MINKILKLGSKTGLIVLLVLSLLLQGCAASKETTTKKEVGAEPYKIGAVVDISGSSSSLGIPERDTLLMLVEQLNAKGGIQGHPVELIILDNKSDETEAVLAAKTLIQKDVLAILGGSSSGTSMSMIKTVQNEKIPMISMAAAIDIVEPISERQWVFKTAQSDIVMVNKIISHLKKNNLTKIALLYMNNAYGDSGKKAVLAATQASGLSVVAEEKFDATDKDMTPQLTRVKASGAEAAIVWAVAPSASIVTKNFKDMDLAIPLIHSHGAGNQKFIDLAQGAAEGVIIPLGRLTVAEQISSDDRQKKILQEYITSYQNKYKTEPNSFGGYAWDAFNLLVSALEKAGADPEAIRDQLEKTQDFIGVSGVFNMSPQDHNGLDEDSAVIVEIKNESWKLIE